MADEPSSGKYGYVAAGSSGHESLGRSIVPRAGPGEGRRERSSERTVPCPKRRWRGGTVPHGQYTERGIKQIDGGDVSARSSGRVAVGRPRAGIPVEPRGDGVGGAGEGWLRAGHEGVCQAGSGEVDGVESPDGLSRKRAPGPIDQLGIQVEDHPVVGGPGEHVPPLGRHGVRQGVRGHSTDQHAIAFDQRQAGCENQLGARERLPDLGRPGLVEQPAEDCARLRVEVQRSPRSWSRSLAAAPAGITLPSAG